MTAPDTPPKRQRFLSTQWSVVASAATGSRQAMEELCCEYWEPLYAHVRRMGYDATAAQDLTQGFFVHLLERRLIESADPVRGRFRTFLLTALRRFVINEWKREHTVNRGGKHPPRLAPAAAVLNRPQQSPTKSSWLVD